MQLKGLDCNQENIGEQVDHWNGKEFWQEESTQRLYSIQPRSKTLFPQTGNEQVHREGSGITRGMYCTDCFVFCIIEFSHNVQQLLHGGLDLLHSLVSFDPRSRASALDVLNSPFMTPLREQEGESQYNENDEVLTYNAFSLKRI